MNRGEIVEKLFFSKFQKAHATYHSAEGGLIPPFLASPPNLEQCRSPKVFGLFEFGNYCMVLSAKHSNTTLKLP